MKANKDELAQLHIEQITMWALCLIVRKIKAGSTNFQTSLMACDSCIITSPAMHKAEYPLCVACLITELWVQWCCLIKYVGSYGCEGQVSWGQLRHPKGRREGFGVSRSESGHWICCSSNARQKRVSAWALLLGFVLFLANRRRQKRKKEHRFQAYCVQRKRGRR